MSSRGKLRAFSLSQKVQQPDSGGRIDLARSWQADSHDIDSDRRTVTDWIDRTGQGCCPCHTVAKLAYTVDEAAGQVGVSGSTLRKEIAEHKLLAHYSGTKVLIRREDLTSWLEYLPCEPRK